MRIFLNFVASILLMLFSLELESQIANAQAALPSPIFTVTPTLSSPDYRASSEYRGWDYLVAKLRTMGVPEKTLKFTYGSSKMPPFEFVPFGVAPKESHAIYTKFTAPERIDIARTFLKKHLRSFVAAEKRYGVPRYIAAAILLIETECGNKVGEQIVLYRLSRVASVGDPANIDFNLQRLQKDDPSVTREQLEKRTVYLERTFLAEIPAVFKIAHSRRINPLSIKGSSAGAFGLPQFMPTSYLNYAIDGNKNGAVSLFEPADAIASIGNFLSKSGWKKDMSPEQTRKAIWAYNRSDAYIDAVLQVAAELSNSDSRH